MISDQSRQKNKQAMAHQQGEKGGSSEAVNGTMGGTTMDTDTQASTNEHQGAQAEEERSSWLKRTALKLGLDAPTLMIMFK